MKGNHTAGWIAFGGLFLIILLVQAVIELYPFRFNVCAWWRNYQWNRYHPWEQKEDYTELACGCIFIVALFIVAMVLGK